MDKYYVDPAIEKRNQLPGNRINREIMSKTDLVKILFRLEKDSDGYPPVDWESLWAKKVGDDYVIDNIPFFCYGISWGDIIEAKSIDEELHFISHLKSSGHQTIRIIPAKRDIVSDITRELKELGCDTEYDDHHRLIAVDVPPSSSFKTVLAYLNQAESDGILEYEEAAIF